MGSIIKTYQNAKKTSGKKQKDQEIKIVNSRLPLSLDYKFAQLKPTVHLVTSRIPDGYST
ncbi:MAG: hypothetical protein A2020_04610 [Lentisphaerae bacterium GWF2_45_14]|nr:MAG: hypothetical protein A2020_04610 [Lentisphaerae bacterium GWF2_45_14]